MEKVRTICAAACFGAIILLCTTSCEHFRYKKTETSKVTPVKGEDWTVPQLDMPLVYVKPTTFEMGSNREAASEDERPVHKVRISNPFWVGKYEVTEGQYRKFLQATGYSDKSSSAFSQGISDITAESNFPIVWVSWHESVAFCEWLTQRERQAGRLPQGYRYRLPTEAEWEYAARGGHKAQDYIYSGSDNVDAVAWYSKNSGRRYHKVGQKKPNELGIHDMSGNVWEWCLDGYGLYKSTNAVDPVDTEDTSFRVFRGGGWSGPANYCRTKRRFKLPPDKAYNIVGFRVVLAPSVR